MIYRNFSRVGQNKSGELWSSSFGDLDVKSYSPKALFWKTIFRSLGGAAPPNFYTF